MRIFAILPTLLFCLWHLTVAVEIVPGRVSVVVGEGFAFRLEDTVQRRGPLQDCRLSRNNKLYILPPGQNKSHHLATGEIVYPFDSADKLVCGIRVFNATEESRDHWQLTAIDENSNEITANGYVNILEPSGSSCLRNPSYRCDPQESPQLTTCDADGQCKYWRTGKMGFNSYSLDELSGIVNETKTPLNTHTGSTVLECRSPKAITECKAVHVATGEQYFIQDGLQDIRYSAYKTNLENGICQFEFPREVNAAENGQWRIDLISTYYDPNYGDKTSAKSCEFYVVNNETAAKEKLQRMVASTVIVKTTKDAVPVHCVKNAYYPIRLCYLIPTGGGVPSFSKQIEGGNCVFTVTPGNWTCGFNGPTEDDEDFVQHLEVVQYEKEIIEERQSAVNGFTVMECHLIEKQPIQLCMLVAPSGRIYRPTSSAFKSAEYSYYAGGQMATGDCGVQFAKGVEGETGDWQCVIGKKGEEPLMTIIHYALKEGQTE